MNCMVCGYEEKDSSSLFCSNCGKTLKHEPVRVSNPNRVELVKTSYNWQKLLGYFIIASLFVNIILLGFIGWAWLSFLSLIPTSLLLLAFVKTKYSYDLLEVDSKEQHQDTSDLEMPKLRPPGGLGMHP